MRIILCLILFLSCIQLSFAKDKGDNLVASYNSISKTTKMQKINCMKIECKFIIKPAARMTAVYENKKDIKEITISLPPEKRYIIDSVVIILTLMQTLSPESLPDERKEAINKLVEEAPVGTNKSEIRVRNFKYNLLVSNTIGIGVQITKTPIR